MRTWLARMGGVLMLAGTLITSAVADEGKFTKPQLDQMLAPIALYPDDLLTNVLMASTYPLDIVAAARWRKEPANAKLKGDALAKALEAKDWDPSIKALVQFPSVLETMSEQLDWTQKLGDAFLSQQDEVMDEIQVLRAKADEAGTLKSNDQQTVTKQPVDSQQREVIVIEPANPSVVYVPEYEPTVVYGPWWYPDYPPYYWPYPGAAYVNGFFWGAGIAIAGSIWGWNHFDWNRRNIDINVNKWNNINARGSKITSNKWQHSPAHRGPVPYRDKATREKFGQAARAQGNKDFRGYDRDSVDRSKIEARLKDTDHANVKDKGRDAARSRDVDRGDAAKAKQKAASKDKGRDAARNRDVNRGDGAKAKQKAASRQVDRKPSRDVRQAAPKRPSSSAFDVKRGADVKKYSDRGRSSRVAMQGGGGRAHPGGGGGRRGGGGGGRRR